MAASASTGQWRRFPAPTFPAPWEGKFAADVFDLEAGPWQGPLHPPQAIFYIRIRHRVPSEPRPLAEAESMVRNDLKAERFKAALKEPLAEIATHYRISVQDGDEKLTPRSRPARPPSAGS